MILFVCVNFPAEIQNFLVFPVNFNPKFSEEMGWIGRQLRKLIYSDGVNPLPTRTLILLFLINVSISKGIRQLSNSLIPLFDAQSAMYIYRKFKMS